MLAVVAAALAASATLVFYAFFYVVDVEETPMRILVADYVGLDASTKNLSFGATYPGDSSKKAFTVKNIYGRPVRANVEFLGEMGPWVSVPETSFVLQPGEERTLIAAARVPEGIVSESLHEGTMRLVFTRVWS
jgi:hypothetical protein